jgi:hypothetical protein
MFGIGTAGVMNRRGADQLKAIQPQGAGHA